MVHLALALVIATSAAPLGAGATAMDGLCVEVQSPRGGVAIDIDPRRSTRAAPPRIVPFRRLLRKREVFERVGTPSTRDHADISVLLLELDLARRCAADLVRGRSRADAPRFPLRLLMAGILIDSLHIPPPILPG